MSSPVFSKKGFTLIELVIVIAVLGILAGIGIPRFINANASAKGSKVLADLRTIDSAITRYIAVNGSYPASEELSPKYLAEWPTAPTGKFIITSSQGSEKEYDNSGAASYVIADGRATLLGDTHTVDYYLSGALPPASPIEVATKLNNEILNTQWVIDYFAGQKPTSSIDSEAIRQDGTPSHAELIRELLTALGINDEEVSWKVRKNAAGTKLEVYVTKKLTMADVGTKVTVNKYDLNGKIIETSSKTVDTSSIEGGPKYPCIKF